MTALRDTGPPDPRSDDARRQPGVSQGAVESKHADSVAADLSMQAERKAFVTLQARAALAGAELLQMADGSFLLCKWGLTRQLHGPEAAAEMLRQMEGVR